MHSSASGFAFAGGAPGSGCFQSGILLFRWTEAKPEMGAKKKIFFFFKARVGVLEVLRKLAWVLQNYSEGKVPELSPLRGRLSAPREGRRLSRRRRRSGSAGRGAPNGGGQGAAPGRSRRRDGEEAAGVPRQGEALPQARGPRAAGEAGRGAGAPSISGRSGTASRSLCLSQAHTGTHTHTPRVSSSSRSAARTHLHFLNEPLDGCQRRGPARAAGSWGWGGRGAGCSGARRPGRWRQAGGRAAEAAKLTRELGREAGKLVGKERPGAGRARAGLTRRPGSLGGTPGLWARAVRAGSGGHIRRRLFLTAKATEDLARCGWISVALQVFACI